MEKFKFDLEFSDDGTAKPAAPRPKRAYKPEEVEAARAAARAEGEQSAVAQAEQSAARSLDQLAKGLHEVLTMARFALDQTHDDATRLASTIARKLTTHVFEAAPEDYFERVIGECLDLLRREPAIRVSIPATAPASLKTRLEDMARKHGLSGRLNIIVAPQLKGSECQVDWVTGGAEISLEAAHARMDAIIEERIAALEAIRSAPARAAV